MDALLKSFQECSDYQLVVVTTASIPQTVRVEEKGITYYALSGGVPMLYDENSKENRRIWSQLLQEEKPSLIQVWGTEFTHGLCALRCAKSIPSVIYMQGYLWSIARYYYAGISHGELFKNITLRDVLKRDSIIQQRKKYARSSMKEKEMLQLSGRIITENEWCERSIRMFFPNIINYKCPLNINEVFGQAEWQIEEAEKHTIVCTASGYPLKGLHMVLRAIAVLKNEYPDIKLYVPGPKMVSDGSIEWCLRKRGYTKYIEGLIKELGLSDSIIWLGSIPQQELAQVYEKARVFVLSSAIENHSSSLKEAMMVGTPCVASKVGGVPEYVMHNEDAMLYRFEEYEVMASYVKQIFNDDALALKLSQNGKKKMLELHKPNYIFKRIQSIYNDIIDGEKE